MKKNNLLIKLLTLLIIIAAVLPVFYMPAYAVEEEYGTRKSKEKDGIQNVVLENITVQNFTKNGVLCAIRVNIFAFWLPCRLVTGEKITKSFKGEDCNIQ